MIWGARVDPYPEFIGSQIKINTIDKRIAINSDELGLTNNPEKIAQLQQERTILLADKDHLVKKHAKVKEEKQPQQTEANNRVYAGFGMCAAGIAGLVIRLLKR